MAFGHIKDNDVGMELWSDVSIDRASRIVLKLRSDELARTLRRIIPADAGLDIVLELVEGYADACSMGFSDAIIASHKSGPGAPMTAKASLAILKFVIRAIGSSCSLLAFESR